MGGLRKKVYISTTADDAAEMAAEYSLGLEIADFCTAFNMDRHFEEYDRAVREKISGVSRLTFHAAYNELCPAAIDPLVREVTEKRYRQSIDLALSYGIRKIVIHSGFIPQIYFPQWFVPESIQFWKGFMHTAPEDVTICLENVMELSPALLPEIVEGVGDRRLRLCLDIGHAFSRHPAIPLEQWIDAFAPYLAHVHIHDNNGDQDAHLPLGKGGINMVYVLDRIASRAPEATFTIENMHAADSVGWLCKNKYI